MDASSRKMVASLAIAAGGVLLLQWCRRHSRSTHAQHHSHSHAAKSNGSGSQNHKSQDCNGHNSTSHDCTGHDHGESHGHGDHGHDCAGHDHGGSQGHGDHGHDCAGHDHGGSHAHGDHGHDCAGHDHGGSHGHGDREHGQDQSHDHGHSHGGKPCHGHNDGSLAVRASELAIDPSLSLEADLERRLRARFAPLVLEVVNHGGTCSAPKVEVTMVSETFQDVKRLDRQRLVQALLKDDLDSNRIHALTLQLRTPKEYAKTQGGS
eukprot:TRINITY_DN7794_c0_g1_i1.p1 TRINITY_DN7794_c0_g1~~TRINITY_DN7794_c0_g1_i1.p1  ORF type:complete len:282 (+),score=37.50 TRINITY_DN7794_c0_g1_i1:55-846(+)